METDTLGMMMVEAGNDLSSGTPAYGSALVKCGEAQKNIGTANREFLQTTVNNFLHPLQTFLDGDMKIFQKEKSTLETRRLDLDAVKSKLKRTKPPGSEPVEAELKASQAEFDRQLEVTKKLLDAIETSHVQHQRILQDFIEAQASFFSKAHQYMSDLLKQLSAR
jgi:endophilin-B